MSISAVVITLNEQANIRQCLQGLSFADEIVVLDSCSSDDTLDIAREFTDRVAFRPFDGFSNQKNAALAMASKEWILVIDADEIVSPELAQEIQHAAQVGEYEAFWVPRLTSFLGQNMRHCGWYPDYQLRLVRRQIAHYPDRLVHETMSVDVPSGKLRADLLHTSYVSLDDYCRKMVSYARAAAKQKYLDGKRFCWLDLLVKPPLAFFKMYVLKRGFLDGFAGFMLSLLTAVSTTIRYCYLWEFGKSSTMEE